MLAGCQKATSEKEASYVDFNRGELKRNRVEKRKTQVFFKDKFENFLDKKWNKYVKTIVKIERNTFRYNTKTKVFDKSSEVSYYISTVDKLNAKEFGEAIRNHWAIENRNHCVRDVSMNEDKSRIRINPDIFATLRSFGLNIMRNNNVENISEAMFRNSLNISRIFKYKELFD